MLTVTRVLAVAALSTFLLAEPSAAQVVPGATEKLQPMAADADPSFEVATVKPSDPGHPGADSPFGHEVSFSGMSIRFLMAFVYDVHDKQIVGAPAWLASEKFDIQGVADVPGTPDLQQVKVMLQKLLVDRLQLKFHRETMDVPAYVLTVAKSGPKLDRSKVDASGKPSLLGRPDLGMKGRNLTMTTFAQLLQGGIMDRPVVDQTRLEGKYDFVLKWTPDPSQFGGRFPPPKDSANAPPGLYTALQEQLGLRLVAQKVPLDVMVIDRIEKPSAN